MDEPLASWQDRDAKRSIQQFVSNAVTAGDGFIEPADRIAVFDNDGTLWIEQPLPVQLDFIFRALAPGRADGPVVGRQGAVQGDPGKDKEFFEAVSEQQPDAIRALRGGAGAGRGWARRPTSSRPKSPPTCRGEVERFGVPYPELVYKPMLELFDFLAANEFRVFVCSGGGREFMRVIAESAWNIPRSTSSARRPATVRGRGHQARRRGARRSRPGRRQAGAHLRLAGRLPAFAGGNADVDIEMLECAKFAMLVVHDDADREFAYTAAAEKSVAAGQEERLDPGQRQGRLEVFCRSRLSHERSPSLI